MDETEKEKSEWLKTRCLENAITVHSTEEATSDKAKHILTTAQLFYNFIKD